MENVHLESDQTQRQWEMLIKHRPKTSYNHLTPPLPFSLHSWTQWLDIWVGLLLGRWKEMPGHHTHTVQTDWKAVWCNFQTHSLTRRIITHRHCGADVVTSLVEGCISETMEAGPFTTASGTCCASLFTPWQNAEYNKQIGTAVIIFRGWAATQVACSSAHALYRPVELVYRAGLKGFGFILTLTYTHAHKKDWSRTSI